MFACAYSRISACLCVFVFMCTCGYVCESKVRSCFYKRRWVADIFGVCCRVYVFDTNILLFFVTVSVSQCVCSGEHVFDGG